MAGEEGNVEMENTEETVEDIQNNETDGDLVTATQDSNSNERIVKIPLTRIKAIIKSDPDVSFASSEAVVILSKATELFIQMLSKDAMSSTTQSKRKTLQRKDLDSVVDTRDSYAFLEGALDGP